MWSNFKFGLVVQEEMLFKEKDYQRKDARHTKTNQNSSPWALGSAELTKMATKIG